MDHLHKFLTRLRPAPEKRRRTLDLMEVRATVIGGAGQNSDGSSRQQVIAACKKGEELQLIPVLESQYDVEALRVCRANGEQLGYLEASCAAVVREERKRGLAIRAIIDEVYQAQTAYPEIRLGVQVRITISPVERKVA